jgi:pimeloyl-ACP methyl ester carboxylesterase
MLFSFGFNLRNQDSAQEWMDEIILQPQQILKRMLFELPGTGRAPFTLPTSPAIPTLFIWGQQDAIIARPPRLRPNDIIIFANHCAPVLAPQSVIEVVLPFFQQETVRHEKAVSMRS